MNQERQLLLLNFAFSHFPHEHRITRENAVQAHEGASAIRQLLCTGRKQCCELVLRVLRQGLAFIRLDLRTSHRTNLGMLRQALAAKSIHYCLVLQILPSVFQMDGDESPWLDPKAESS